MDGTSRYPRAWVRLPAIPKKTPYFTAFCSSCGRIFVTHVLGRSILQVNGHRSGEALVAPKGYDKSMGRQFQVFVEHDPSEDAWVTYVPALDHLSTFGSTREQALENTREAILGYLEAAEKEGIKLNVGTASAELVQIAV
jgi:predicted RNase H-like HicB family nuclease